jgi:hypothetical protein
VVFVDSEEANAVQMREAHARCVKFTPAPPVRSHSLKLFRPTVIVTGSEREIFDTQFQ